MPRHADKDWNLPESCTLDYAVLAVLMDIRTELRAIRAVLQCPNVQKMALAAQRVDKRLAKRIKLP